MDIKEKVYMILGTNNDTGETFWIKTGRGAGTPFTTTRLSSARGEITKYRNCNMFNKYTYKLVKIYQVEVAE